MLSFLDPVLIEGKAAGGFWSGDTRTGETQGLCVLLDLFSDVCPPAGKGGDEVLFDGASVVLWLAAGSATTIAG